MASRWIQMLYGNDVAERADDPPLFANTMEWSREIKSIWQDVGIRKVSAASTG
jgi:hypothetical protein